MDNPSHDRRQGERSLRSGFQIQGGEARRQDDGRYLTTLDGVTVSAALCRMFSRCRIAFMACCVLCTVHCKRPVGGSVADNRGLAFIQCANPAGLGSKLPDTHCFDLGSSTLSNTGAPKKL